jgi:hypothetical protein
VTTVTIGAFEANTASVAHPPQDGRAFAGCARLDRDQLRARQPSVDLRIGDCLALRVEALGLKGVAEITSTQKWIGSLMGVGMADATTPQGRVPVFQTGRGG